MRELTVTERDCSQQLIKYLSKYMQEAPKSFFYKMLRKKNILLNGKKAQGSEKLCSGDTIRLYLAEETIEKFRGAETKVQLPEAAHVPFPEIVYEDELVVFLNKPAGVLSQKAVPEDVSLSEQLAAYLLSEQARHREEETMFRPGLSNRLDRNTSGLVLAGKTTQAVQTLDGLIARREVRKYYLTVVKGHIRKTERIQGYLMKRAKTNQAYLVPEGTDGALWIETAYEPLAHGRDCTLLKVELITGKTHQIRCHLASTGHPVAGDGKYGDPAFNRRFREDYGLKYQLLHSFQVEFPQMDGVLSHLSGRSFTAPVPERFTNIIAGEKLSGEQS